MRLMPLKCFLLTVLVFMGLKGEVSAQTQPTEKPNFIVFIADDMAWDDCGAYGHTKIQTPNLNQLAKDGMKFNHAYLTCSSCSPSRASIITGRYPHSTGAHQLHLPLPASQVTFVEKLKAAGYYTASAGKWHLGTPTESKFDLVTTKMNEWVSTLKQRPKEKPFFMWFAFTDPHRPYQRNIIDRPHTNEDVVVPPYLPDTPEVRGDLALYYDEIARLDGVVGNVRKELNAQKVASNTVIIFLSDNGRPFPRCKTTMYDSGIRTPWIVAWPAQVKAGSVSDSLISSVDLAPTVLDLAGLPVGETFQGKSFRKLLKNPKATTRGLIFAEHNWHDFEDFGRAVRSPRYKYIRNFYTDIPGTPPADAVRSDTYVKMLELRDAGKLTEDQQSCFQIPRQEVELYDVQTDPHELHNLAGNPEYAEVQQELRTALDQWQEETHDRLPRTRRPDEFDRETGQQLPAFRKK
ncbi:Arylsulfatase precursor [Gimesia maris]|uniref:sulfatase family protein n=1 Tax=Gimesia maris TaxID=122 RepID=UPI00118AC990|nr:sulfatase [Gimesia maris]QDU13631.1 Arylsulfatase precursor [Gimesia maris]